MGIAKKKLLQQGEKYFELMFILSEITEAKLFVHQNLNKHKICFDISCSPMENVKEKVTKTFEIAASKDEIFVGHLPILVYD